MIKSLKQIKICGIVLLILGIIHCSAIPFILPMFSSLKKMEFQAFIFMFESTGLALAFVGWLQFYLSKQEFLVNETKMILLVSIILIQALGIGAVITMYDNPFAYISLLVALYELFWLKSIVNTPVIS